MINIKKYSLLLLMCAQASGAFALGQNRHESQQFEVPARRHRTSSSSSVAAQDRSAATEKAGEKASGFVRFLLDSLYGAAGSAAIAAVGTGLATALSEYGMNSLSNAGLDIKSNSLKAVVATAFVTQLAGDYVGRLSGPISQAFESMRIAQR